MKEWQQNLFPQHALSRLMGALANAKLGKLTHWFIKKFVKHYGVDLSEAQITDPNQFATFNDFFTRALKPSAREIVKSDDHLICPVDGAISELGGIEQGSLLQAKGAYYSVADLCGDDIKLAASFANGAFLTAYLSPKDYHRFHMPLTGKLIEMIYVPGNLFSVNQSSVKNVSRLFARNERVICVFETAIGKVAVIAVGAMIVGSVEIVGHGIVAPQKSREITRWSFADAPKQFMQGDELGRFRLGSTIILLCEQDKVRWDQVLQAESALQMGQVIANVRHDTMQS